MQTTRSEFRIVAVDSLRPDPDQPRRSIKSEDVKELAQSIAGTGLINPVEVDPTGMIITGEIRWRAAKEADLDEIPVRELEIKPTERLTRQLAENLHQHAMAPMDTAKAIKKLYSSLVDPRASSNDRGISAIARSLGKSEGYIREMLLLEELGHKDSNIAKKVGSGDVSYTTIIEAERFPEPIRKEIKERVMGGEIKNRKTLQFIKQAITESPDLTDEILAEDYSGTMAENITKIKKVAPSAVEMYNNASDKARIVYNTANHLLRAMREIQYLQAPPLLQPGLKMALEEVQKQSKDWLDISQYE